MEYFIRNYIDIRFFWLVVSGHRITNATWIVNNSCRLWAAYYRSYVFFCLHFSVLVSHAINVTICCSDNTIECCMLLDVCYCDDVHVSRTWPEKKHTLANINSMDVWQVASGYRKLHSSMENFVWIKVVFDVCNLFKFHLMQL